MRGSLSNAKQEIKVDQNHLSVVAAEMGIDYYRVFYENQFIYKRNMLINKYKTNYEGAKKNLEGDKEFKNKKSEDQEIAIMNLSQSYRELLLKELSKYLKTVELSYPTNHVYFKKKDNFKVNDDGIGRDIH